MHTVLRWCLFSWVELDSKHCLSDVATDYDVKKTFRLSFTTAIDLSACKRPVFAVLNTCGWCLQAVITCTQLSVCPSSLQCFLLSTKKRFMRCVDQIVHS